MQIDLRTEVLTSSKGSSTPEGKQEPSFRLSTELEPKLPEQNRWVLTRGGDAPTYRTSTKWILDDSLDRGAWYTSSRT